MIITADDIAREQQDGRCRLALRMIDVPENVLWSLKGPLLWQLAHLCCVIDQPMHWRDALRWMQDHKGEILAHAQETEKLKHEQNTTPATSTDGKADGEPLVTDAEGQPIRVR